MAEPVWVREDVVRAVHRRLLAEHGGMPGVRDDGLLASALLRPRTLAAYAEPAPGLATLAAAYAWGIARYHPFHDGNKRAALVVACLFLQLNGQDVDATQEDKYLTFLRLAAGELDEGALAAWFSARVVRIAPSPDGDSP